MRSFNIFIENLYFICKGYGYSMESRKAKEIFNKALPNRNFEKVKSGAERINNKEAEKLFQVGSYGNMKETKTLFTKTPFRLCPN